MATRVFELARTLGVTSKVVLEKCRAEGLDIKNHMSTLSAGLEATIREWFSESAGEGTAIEVADHVDLESARKEARRQRRKQITEVQEEPVAQAEGTAAEPEEALEPAGVATAEAPAETPGAAAPVMEQVAPEAQAEAVGTAEPIQPPEGPRQPPAEEPAEILDQKKEGPKKPEPVRPAGPQVVPKPAALKGPRVVRVDRPDFLSPPRPRPTPSAEALAQERDRATGVVRKGKVDVADEGEDTGKKRAKRRSPRRRGGRSADSGDHAKEWRNQDLVERSERLAAAGGGLRRHRANVTRRHADAAPTIHGERIEIAEPMTV